MYWTNYFVTFIIVLITGIQSFVSKDYTLLYLLSGCPGDNGIAKL